MSRTIMNATTALYIDLVLSEIQSHRGVDPITRAELNFRLKANSNSKAAQQKNELISGAIKHLLDEGKIRKYFDREERNAVFFWLPGTYTDYDGLQETVRPSVLNIPTVVPAAPTQTVSLNIEHVPPFRVVEVPATQKAETPPSEPVKVDSLESTEEEALKPIEVICEYMEENASAFTVGDIHEILPQATRQHVGDCLNALWKSGIVGRTTTEDYQIFWHCDHNLFHRNDKEDGLQLISQEDGSMLFVRRCGNVFTFSEEEVNFFKERLAA